MFHVEWLCEEIAPLNFQSRSDTLKSLFTFLQDTLIITKHWVILMSTAVLCPEGSSGLFCEEGEKSMVSLWREWAPITNTGVLTAFDFPYSKASYMGCINFAFRLACYLAAELSISAEYLNDCTVCVFSVPRIHFMTEIYYCFHTGDWTEVI